MTPMVTVNLRLECGCTFPPREPIPAYEAVHPGLIRDCPRGHGPRLIARVATRLVQP